jgi:polysaccharide biosynthesis transport protein
MADPTARKSLLHDRPYPRKVHTDPGTAVWPPDRAPSPDYPEVSLDLYLGLFRRRKGIVSLTFVLVFLLGLFVTRAITPTYRVATRILLEGPEIGTVDHTVADPLSNLFMPDAGHDIATQIQVLQGAQVLADAYQEVGIPASAVRLDIQQVGATDIIEIGAESTTPELAAQIVRQMPLTYRTYLTGHRKAELREALSFSQARLRAEQTRLRQAEQRLEQFMASLHMPDLEAVKNDQIARLGDRRADLTRLAMETARAEARLQSALANRHRQPAVVENRTTTFSSFQRGSVSEDIARLELARQEALNLYRPDQFQVRRLDTLIAAQQQRLERTPDRFETDVCVTNPNLDAYDQQIAEARGNWGAACASLARRRQAVVDGNAALQKYSALDTRLLDLQGELQRREETVAALTRTVTLLDLRDKAAHDPVRVVSAPGMPEQIEPKMLTNLTYSFVVGVILALALALLQEFLDDRLTSPEEVHVRHHMAMLGYVPLIDAEESRLLNERRSSSFVLESYRVLRANVQFAATGAGAKSLVVTSTIPDEGKSLTAANLAVALALDGQRVILVDTDLRRPSLHTKFGTAQSPGLTHILLDPTGLREALRPTSLPNLLLLTAGTLPPNPTELLHSQPMQRIHEQLTAWADVVIYDSPPCLAAGADTQVLAELACGVLYVVQFGETRRSGLQHALELLAQTTTPLLGVIYNKIDLEQGRPLYEAGYFNYDLTTQGDRACHNRSEFEVLLSHRDRATARGAGNVEAPSSPPLDRQTDREERVEPQASAAVDGTADGRDEETEEGMPV